MNNREKKPPVNINELKKVQEEEEHEKGPLNYMGEKNDPRGGPATKSKVNLTQLILAIGISVLVFFLIAQFTLTSKSDSMVLLDNQKLLESSQAATGAQLNTETGRIENVIAAQANFAQKSELAGFDNAITSIGNRVDEIEPIVDRIEPIVDDHEDRIVDLEAAINGTSTVVGGGSYCYLTKQADGFGLTAMSSRTGFFLAQVTLVLDDPSVLSDVVGTDRNYIENMGFIEGTWKTVSITVYTGEFKLNSGEVEGDLEIPLDLSSEVEVVGYEAYVELLPSAVTSTGGGSVI